VERLRQQRPEVPVVVGAAQVGARVALDGVVEVGELERVAEEEDRRVVADQVPVALFGIELDGEAADVPLGVGRSALARHRREADEDRRLLAGLREEPGPGVTGDVVGYGEVAESAAALGVHAPLGDYLPVEVGEFLEKPDILKKLRASGTGRQDVGIVRHGGADRVGHSGDVGLLVCHSVLLRGNLICGNTHVLGFGPASFGRSENLRRRSFGPDVRNPPDALLGDPLLHPAGVPGRARPGRTSSPWTGPRRSRFSRQAVDSGFAGALYSPVHFR